MKVEKSTDQMSQQDEDRLAARMAQGDLAALDVVYRRYADEVYTAVVRIVGSGEAEDVTHDAFLRAFERAHQFRGSGGLAGWIRVIGVNLALQQVRRRRNRLRLRTEKQSPPPVLAHPASAQLLDLERNIAELPEALRLIFILVGVEGRTHADVAAHLDISITTSRKRYQRARERLAELMEDEQ